MHVGQDRGMVSPGLKQPLLLVSEFKTEVVLILKV